MYWVFGILIVVIGLFLSDRVRPDLVAMIALTAVAFLGILEPSEVLAGFSNPATVTIACMFVLSAGLYSSGFVSLIGDWIVKHGPKTEGGLLSVLAAVLAPISAFVNNTAAVAVFMPVAMKASIRSRIHPGRLLMPMAFLAILGGTCTLIGTSTNILVSSLAKGAGLEPFRLFELTPLGLVFLAVGAVYLLTFGRLLLPQKAASESLRREFHLSSYLTEVSILDDSPLVGLTLQEANLPARFDLEILGIGKKGELVQPVTDASVRLQAGDILLVKATAESLTSIHVRQGLAIRPALHSNDPDLKEVDSALYEAILQPNSPLIGRTLKSANFRASYGATALAIRRRGEDIVRKIGLVPLMEGDELLILMPRDHIARFRDQPGLVILGEVEPPAAEPLKIAIAGAIVFGVVLLAGLGVYPVVVTAVAGSVLMVVTGCLPVRRVYESIDWRVIFLLAGVIPLGAAMERSGAATAMVDTVLGVSQGFGPRVVMMVFVAMTFAVTGLMSNNATAALMVPLALGAAAKMGVDPRPFLVAIMFSASAAFWTPVGYQTNLLVYGPGGYRFLDYTRVGLPLNLTLLILAGWLIPVFFPF